MKKHFGFVLLTISISLFAQQRSATPSPYSAGPLSGKNQPGHINMLTDCPGMPKDGTTDMCSVATACIAAHPNNNYYFPVPSNLPQGVYHYRSSCSINAAATDGAGGGSVYGDGHVYNAPGTIPTAGTNIRFDPGVTGFQVTNGSVHDINVLNTEFAPDGVQTPDRAARLIFPAGINLIEFQEPILSMSRDSTGLQSIYTSPYQSWKVGGQIKIVNGDSSFNGVFVLLNSFPSGSNQVYQVQGLAGAAATSAINSTNGCIVGTCIIPATTGVSNSIGIQINGSGMAKEVSVSGFGHACIAVNGAANADDFNIENTRTTGCRVEGILVPGGEDTSAGKIQHPMPYWNLLWGEVVFPFLNGHISDAQASYNHGAYVIPGGPITTLSSAVTSGGLAAITTTVVPTIPISVGNAVVVDATSSAALNAPATTATSACTSSGFTPFTPNSTLVCTTSLPPNFKVGQVGLLRGTSNSNFNQYTIPGGTWGFRVTATTSTSFTGIWLNVPNGTSTGGTASVVQATGFVTAVSGGGTVYTVQYPYGTPNVTATGGTIRLASQPEFYQTAALYGGSHFFAGKGTAGNMIADMAYCEGGQGNDNFGLCIRANPSVLMLQYHGGDQIDFGFGGGPSLFNTDDNGFHLRAPGFDFQGQNFSVNNGSGNGFRYNATGNGNLDLDKGLYLHGGFADNVPNSFALGTLSGNGAAIAYGPDSTTVGSICEYGITSTGASLTQYLCHTPTASTFIKPVILPGDPSASLGAATKQYVDSRVVSASGLADPTASGVVVRTTAGATRVAIRSDFPTQQGTDVTKDFGANNVPTDGTSDFGVKMSAIMATVDATGKPELHIPAGVYNLTTTASYVGNNPVTIICEGKAYQSGGTVQFKTSNNIDIFSFAAATIPNQKGVKMVNCNVSDVSGTGAAIAGIRIKATNNFEITDVSGNGFIGTSSNTGTVTTTAGSTAVSCTCTDWTSAMNGGLMMVAGIPHMILSVTDGSNAVLTQPYEVTDPAGAGQVYSIETPRAVVVLDPGGSFSQYGEIKNLNGTGNKYQMYAIGGASGSVGTSRVTVDGGFTNCSRVPNSIAYVYGGYSDTHKLSTKINNCYAGLYMERAHQTTTLGSYFENTGTLTKVPTCPAEVAATAAAGGVETPAAACMRGVIIRGYTFSNTLSNAVVANYFVNVGLPVDIGYDAWRTVITNNTYSGNVTNCPTFAEGTARVGHGSTTSFIQEASCPTTNPNVTQTAGMALMGGYSTPTAPTNMVQIIAPFAVTTPYNFQVPAAPPTAVGMTLSCGLTGICTFAAISDPNAIKSNISGTQNVLGNLSYGPLAGAVATSGANVASSSVRFLNSIWDTTVPGATTCIGDMQLSAPGAGLINSVYKFLAPSAGCPSGTTFGFDFSNLTGNITFPTSFFKHGGVNNSGSTGLNLAAGSNMSVTNTANTVTYSYIGFASGITASATPALIPTSDVNRITITSNSSPTWAAGSDGFCSKVFITEGIGGTFTWTWPSNVVGGGTVVTTAARVNAQTFCYNSASTQWQASAAMVNY